MLKAYPQADRSYLGKENALFLILRTALQGLAQVRLLRTNISPKLVTLEQKLENIDATLNNQVHRESLLALINEIHTKLYDAEDFRILASNENQARHTSIINACQGSRHSNPFEEDDEDLELGGNLSTHPQRPINQNKIVTTTPCAKIDFGPFRKYLRMCPSQKN